MADGPFGAREVFLDLTATGARTIRDGTLDGMFVQIQAIKLQGTSGAGAGDIVLHSDSATGNIVFKEAAPGGTQFDGTLIPLRIRCQGLYMDALANAWTAGSTLVIYTQ